MSTITQSWCI